MSIIIIDRENVSFLSTSALVFVSLVAHQGESVISTVWLSPRSSSHSPPPQSSANCHTLILKDFISCQARLSAASATDVVLS